MARPRRESSGEVFLTAEQLEEIKMMENSPEVKAAIKECDEIYKARRRLYNLRSLYKRGVDLLAEKEKKKNATTSN